MTTLAKPTTAAQRRAILANAHAAWFNSSNKIHDRMQYTKDIKAALVETNMIALTDEIVDVRLEGTTVCVFLDCDDWREVLELDAYGNVLKGQGE